MYPSPAFLREPFAEVAQERAGSSEHRSVVPSSALDLSSFRTSQRGRLWTRRGFGPPLVGTSPWQPPDVQMTPIADPSSATIGEPDIPLTMPSMALETRSMPPLCCTEHWNHRPSSDSSHAVPFDGESAMGNGIANS